MKLNNYDTIILDCDGVIFDSNNLKLNAMRKALNEFDEKIVIQKILKIYDAGAECLHQMK